MPWRMVSLAPSTSPIPGSIARGASADLIQAAAALVLFAILLFDPRVLGDGDTYWHLAAGEWMLAHGQVLHRDVFSYTHAGQPWETHEWLSEILMAAVFRAGGWSGLLVLYATAAAATVGLIAGRVKRSLGGLTLVAVLVLAMACSAGTLLVRPHLLVLPIMIVWLRELLAARDAGRAPRWFMPALLVLWANLHGSYVFGLLLMGPFALEALVEAPPGARLSVLRRWAPVCLASAAGMLLTPHGMDGVTYPFKIMSMGTLNAISEWQPADFSKPSAFEFTLLLTLFVSLWRGVRVPPVRLVLLLFLLYMALQHGRHMMVLAVTAPLILAEPLAAALGRQPQPRAGGRRTWAAFGALAVVLAVGRMAVPVARVDGEATPLTALAQVPPALAGRPMINSYDFGGYLIFKGVKPFIDGRSDMYGDAQFRRFLQIRGGDRPSLDAAVRRYGVAWTLLQPDEPLVAVLDATPGWRRLYADRYAVVHQRIAPAAAPAAQSDGHDAATR
jgi:hypothetical protein